MRALPYGGLYLLLGYQKGCLYFVGIVLLAGAFEETLGKQPPNRGAQPMMVLLFPMLPTLLMGILAGIYC